MLILTHRRNLVEQFLGEFTDRGYRTASRRRLLGTRRRRAAPTGPSPSRPTSGSCATAKISDAYTIVICDEAHTALGEKYERRDPQLDRPRLHRHDRGPAR